MTRRTWQVSWSNVMLQSTLTPCPCSREITVCIRKHLNRVGKRVCISYIPSHGELCVELSEVVPGRCDMAVLLLQTDLLEAPIVTGVLSLVGFSQVVFEIHLCIYIMLFLVLEMFIKSYKLSAFAMIQSYNTSRWCQCIHYEKRAFWMKIHIPLIKSSSEFCVSLPHLGRQTHPLEYLLHLNLWKTISLSP